MKPISSITADPVKPRKEGDQFYSITRFFRAPDVNYRNFPLHFNPFCSICRKWDKTDFWGIEWLTGEPDPSKIHLLT